MSNSSQTSGFSETLRETYSHTRARLIRWWLKRFPRPICDSIQTWAKQYPGAETFEVIPAEPLERKLPHTLSDTIPPIFLKTQFANVPPKYVARLPNVRLVGRDGMLLLPTNSWAREWAFIPERIKNHPLYADPLALPIEKKAGNYYSFLWYHGRGNYYHWLRDGLLRLYKTIDILPPDTQFIIPSNLPPNFISSLACLGIEPSQCVPFDGKTIWQVESLYLASYGKGPTFDSPAEVDWLRRRMWQSCGISKAKRTKRIFVSRQGAKWRRLVNEPEIWNYLQGYGFESVQLETLSFEQQVQLFSQAEIVVAPHGAGNVNMLFAPPGACLIEFFSPDYMPQVYLTLCSGLDITYWYLIAETVAPDARGPLYVDIRVPLDPLRQVINTVLEHSPASN